MTSTSQYLSFPAVRLFLFTYLAVTFFGFWGWSHFYRDPGSIFFDESHAFEQLYSEQRAADARTLLESGQTWTRAFAAEKLKKTGLSTPEFCVVVPTVFREGLPEQYIRTTIASLVQGLTAQERHAIQISLYFADADHTKHPDWDATWLAALVDDAWAFNADGGKFSPEYHAATERLLSSSPSGRTKGTVDYALAIQRCLDTTEAPYIAVFEGDTLISEGWVALTLAALRQADDVTHADSGNYKDWLSVRLFNQERSTGWNGRHVGANNEFLIIAIVDSVVLLVSLFLRTRSTAGRSYLTNGVLAVLCLITVPVTTILFFQAGKASLLPPSPGLRVESFGCCSQAFVFNRHTVAGLVSSLRDRAAAEIEGLEHVNYDITTVQWARQQHLAELALYPMQVQHMGLQSAAGGLAGEARKVWSMAFESLTSGMLQARRSRAMAVVFGERWRADAVAAGWSA